MQKTATFTAKITEHSEGYQTLCSKALIPFLGKRVQVKVGNQTFIAKVGKRYKTKDYFIGYIVSNQLKDFIGKSLEIRIRLVKEVLA
jgi:hypothetical protein